MFRIVVNADYAIFTRPECKVERTSYPVPTPSAIVGMLKSVYWKPSIRYVIDKIIVFNPINFVSVRRNEVKDKILESVVKSQMKGLGGNPCIYTKESISQRASLLLKDVKYGIEFHFELTGIRSESEENGNGKHASIIERRLKNGQYFKTPCMGCREFSVRKIELVEEFDYTSVDKTLYGDIDLGNMLYELDYKDDERLKSEWNNKYFSDNAIAKYYHPFMVDGVIEVEKYWGKRK